MVFLSKNEILKILIMNYPKEIKLKKQFKILIWFVLLVSIYGCQNIQQQSVFVGVSVAPSYEYYMTGRTDLLKGYVIRVDNLKNLKSPGLVFLASGIERENEAYLVINETRYDIPPLAGGNQEKIQSDVKSIGKAQFYSVSSGDDIVGKFVIPLKTEEVVEGINDVAFYMNMNTDGFEVLAAQIQSVIEQNPAVVSQTYHLLARGRPAMMKDFDYVTGYHGEKIWHEKDIPDWAQRGKVNFYRAGIDYENLDRMFELFAEARINLVAVGVPRDINSAEYKRIKEFVDRCHKKNIYITAFNSLGGVRLQEWIMDPSLEAWISHDEYGAKRWRQPGKVFAADLANVNYRNYELKYAALQIDTGVDELYYDYAIGGTGDVLEFLTDVRAIAKEKGRHVTIYGNCKGNILVDEVCDLTKSEGTTEAGVWEGKWVHNIPQARFYYAVGNGVKPYRSKYEGADPGVPNPGAYDVRDGMKAGWKKPIAEASAFQSHFAIAEAGAKLRDAWIKKDNPLAMEIWKSISDYYRFLAENQDLYTDVISVSKIAVLAPPLIPSFEVSLKRESLYNALAELSVMYDVVLLHRLTDADLLSKYSALIIPNIPWIEESHLAAIQTYKRAGGKVFAIGDMRELRELADIVAPTELFTDLNDAEGRKLLLDYVGRLSGEQIISLEGSPYVVANVVHKRDTDRFVLHFVNYDNPVKNIRVKVNLDGFTEKLAGEAQLISPDEVPKEVKNIIVHNKTISFTIPNLDIYNVVEIN
jgi:hypothetical protein